MDVYVVWQSHGGMCWERFNTPNAAKQTVNDVLKRAKEGESGTRLFWVLTGPTLTLSDLHALCETTVISDKEA